MSAQLALDIKDAERNNIVAVSANSERAISLAEGNTYKIGCRPSGNWAGDHISSNAPANAHLTAAFVTMEGTKQTLTLQNFSVALSGNYTCSSDSESKRLTIHSGKACTLFTYFLHCGHVNVIILEHLVSLYR